jgi:flagellar motor component MotA
MSNKNIANQTGTHNRLNVGDKTTVEFNPVQIQINSEFSTNKENWIYRFFKSNWFLIGIVIILAGVIVFNQFYKITEANNVTYILSFVGILSTFIVVSNFAQVKDVQSKFEELVFNQTNIYNEKLRELYEEKEHFKLKSNGLLSLMYLEISEIYYLTVKKSKSDYNSTFQYKLSVLNSICYAEKAKDKVLLDKIEKYLSIRRVGAIGLTEIHKLQINKILQQINIEQINKLGGYAHIEQFIFY